MIMCRRPYFLAVFFICIAALIRLSLNPLLGPQAPMVIFLFPVMAISAKCGWKAGLLSALLGVSIAEWAFAAPQFAFHSTMIEWTRASVYLVESSCIVWLADKQRHYNVSAIKAEREAEQLMTLAETARKAAEDASKAKDKFIAALSHELRTPLTPVAAAVTTLESDPMVAGDHREMLSIAHRNIDIEIKLIDDLLDLSRINAGKMVLRRVPTSLHESIQNAYKVLHPTARAKDVSLTLDLSASRDCIDADPTRIDQVVWNLIGNALKFTPFGGKVVVRTVNDDHSVAMEVDDNGVGIPPDLMPRLFKPFEQGEHMTRQYGGLGLGLSISNTVVAAHGGTLTAESKAEGGARFKVKLPITDKTPIPNESLVIPRPSPRGKAKLLLVEDHADTARLMAKILRSRGYEVTIAGTVADALAISEAERFDLMVSDLGLPDGSGHDVMSKIKGTGIKGIALSGYGTDADKAKSTDAGFAMHLTKPISADVLESTIERVLVEHGNG